MSERSAPLVLDGKKLKDARCPTTRVASSALANWALRVPQHAEEGAVANNKIVRGPGT